MSKPVLPPSPLTGAHDTSMRNIMLGCIGALIVAVIICGFTIANMHKDLTAVKRRLRGLETEKDIIKVDDIDNMEKRLSGVIEKRFTQLEGLKQTQPKQTAQPPASEGATAGSAKESYRYEIIHLTEKEKVDGQDLIYTRRSNLDGFFDLDMNIEIVDTQIFPVWDDLYLLVIYKEKHS